MLREFVYRSLHRSLMVSSISHFGQNVKCSTIHFWKITFTLLYVIFVKVGKLEPVSGTEYYYGLMPLIELTPHSIGHHIPVLKLCFDLTIRVEHECHFTVTIPMVV